MIDESCYSDRENGGNCLLSPLGEKGMIKRREGRKDTRRGDQMTGGNPAGTLRNRNALIFHFRIAFAKIIPFWTSETLAYGLLQAESL